MSRSTPDTHTAALGLVADTLAEIRRSIRDGYPGMAIILSERAEDSIRELIAARPAESAETDDAA